MRYYAGRLEDPRSLRWHQTSGLRLQANLCCSEVRQKSDRKRNPICPEVFQLRQSLPHADHSKSYGSARIA